MIRGNWIHDNVLGGERGVGAGVYREDGAATIIGNRIFNNRIETTVSGYGGGISGIETTVIGNEIYDNHVASGSAGGVHSNRTVRNNVIACNSSAGGGTGFPCSALMAISDSTEANTIVGNWSVAAAPAVLVYVLRNGSAAVLGNNIAYNVGSGIRCFIERHQGQVSLECNNIFGNTSGTASGDCGPVIGVDGNISVEPQFGRGSCPHTPGDWCLGPDSPLLPASSPPGCGLIGALGECSPDAVRDVAAAPGRLEAQAAPNPFAERTSIAFHLGEESEVEVAIVGVLGRKVRALRAGRLAAGDHALEWDGRADDGARAASGAYVAVIRAGAREVTRTLLLVR